MAVTVTSKKNKSAIIHITNANASLVVAGNTSQSNIATADEQIANAVIKQVWWGVDAGSVQVARGGAGAANNVLVLSQTGHMNFAADGTVVNAGNTAANISVNFSGTSNGFIMIEVSKGGTFVSEYFQP